MHDSEDHQHCWYQPDNGHCWEHWTEEEDDPHDDADDPKDNQPGGVTTVEGLKQTGRLDFHDGIDDEPDGEQDGDVKGTQSWVNQDKDP